MGREKKTVFLSVRGKKKMVSEQGGSADERASKRRGGRNGIK